MKYAEVIVSTKSKSTDKIFHYLIPEDFYQKAKVGMRVFVPFGSKNKLIEGYIIGFTNHTDIEKNLIKKIYSFPDKDPIFNENLIFLAKFMSDKYYCTLTECLQCIMPKIVKEKVKKYVKININSNNEHKITEIINKNNAQSKVLKILKNYQEVSLEELKNFLKISISPINTLCKNGFIKIFEKDIESTCEENLNYKFNQNEIINLNEEQEFAVKFLKDKLNEAYIKKPVLLHGVTGSGKTEVYLQVIEETLKKGKQAIVLVPEISLTYQTIERVSNRFGKLVSLTHSKMSATERFKQWQKAKHGEISIMVGARSAIFTPFQNLGVIIVDEEHENTYKSDSTPKYNALEVIEQISKFTGCLVIYASATPSVETYYKVTQNRYDLITLKHRVNKSLPDITIVDMRKELEYSKSIFSRKLFNAINENLKSKMQTILFLNRRGHSRFVSCRKCGHTIQCDNCNVNFTYHSYNNRLICHYCNNSINNPTVCPNCRSKYIKYFGIGTQKVEEEVKKLFPDASVIRMDMDTTSTKNGHALILNKFKNGDADILIGTQMIAKGLDFPKVSLVGVLAADLSIYSGDYKSSENSFQLLMQVSGRAGRDKYLGKVFIQTYNPSHYSIQYAKNNDYLGFFNQEIKDRKNNLYPPFSNLFFVILTSSDEKILQEKIKQLFQIFKIYNKKANFELLGPSMATIYKLNNKFRFKIIVKGKDKTRLKNFVIYCVEKFKKQYYNKDINVVLSLNPNFIP